MHTPAQPLRLALPCETVKRENKRARRQSERRHRPRHQGSHNLLPGLTITTSIPKEKFASRPSMLVTTKARSIYSHKNSPESNAPRPPQLTASPPGSRAKPPGAAPRTHLHRGAPAPPSDRNAPPASPLRARASSPVCEQSRRDVAAAGGPNIGRACRLLSNPAAVVDVAAALLLVVSLLQGRGADQRGLHCVQSV